MESNAVSFTVQTLKREFCDTKEDLETSVGILAIPIVGAVVAVGSAITSWPCRVQCCMLERPELVEAPALLPNHAPVRRGWTRVARE
jgi:hypothetical protein